MNEEKQTVLHPTSSNKKQIDKEKYSQIKKTIMEALTNQELTHSELFQKVEQQLKDTFKGNIMWYMETVKLDLEARHIIKRNTSHTPHTYTLT